jgi:hypothetical protein
MLVIRLQSLTIPSSSVISFTAPNFNHRSFRNIPTVIKLLLLQHRLSVTLACNMSLQMQGDMKTP